MTDLLRYLFEQNPWLNGRRPDSGVLRPHYMEIIKHSLQTPEILVLRGIRRSGKTTLMRQTIDYLLDEKTAKPEEVLFVSCDSDEIQSLENPLEDVLDIWKKEFGISSGLWIFLDEIQSIGNFPAVLKKWRDSGKNHIIISGSSSYLLESKTGNMLAGRYIAVSVYPLSFREYLDFKNIALPKNNIEAEGRKYEFISALRCYLKEGGFPALVSQTEKLIRKNYLEAYYDSIVYRDILSNNPVRNRVAMESLYSYLLSNTATPQNYSSLAKHFSCDASLVRDYIKYAEDGWLLHCVKHFSYSIKKQNMAPKKIYAADTGLRAAVSFVFSEDSGRLAENVVLIELKRRGFEPWYWVGKNEIDFVVKNEDNELLLVNVCLASEIPPRETKGFSEFNEQYPNIKKSSLLLTEDFEGETEGIKCVPLWKWLTEKKD